MINLGPKGACKGHTKTLPEYPFQKPRWTAAIETRFSPYSKHMVWGLGEYSTPDECPLFMTPSGHSRALAFAALYHHTRARRVPISAA
jgi:hypothetical protein